MLKEIQYVSSILHAEILFNVDVVCAHLNVPPSWTIFLNYRNIITTPGYSGTFVSRQAQNCSDAAYGYLKTEPAPCSDVYANIARTTAIFA
jgi:hypothetical protein